MKTTKEQNFERELPAGYKEAMYINAKGAKFGIILNVIAEESRTHTPCGEQFLRLSPNLVLQDRHLASTHFD